MDAAETWKLIDELARQGRWRERAELVAETQDWLPRRPRPPQRPESEWEYDDKLLELFDKHNLPAEVREQGKQLMADKKYSEVWEVLATHLGRTTTLEEMYRTDTEAFYRGEYYRPSHWDQKPGGRQQL